MAVKTSWAAGDVLTAADLTDTFAAKTGKWTEVATGNLTGASVSITSLSGQDFVIYCRGWSATSAAELRLTINNEIGANYVPYSGDAAGALAYFSCSGSVAAASAGYNTIHILNAGGSTLMKSIICGTYGGTWNWSSGVAVTSIQLKPSAGTFDAGTYSVWSVS